MVEVNGGEADKLRPVIYVFHTCFVCQSLQLQIKLPARSDTRANLNITVGAIPK